MTNKDKFIDKYKMLESVTREKFSLKKEDSISYFLQNKYNTQPMKGNIAFCQEVCNLLQHSGSQTMYVDPNDDMISFVDSMIERIRNRKKCSAAGVGIKDVFFGTMEDNVMEIMQGMRKAEYTFAPIIDSKGGLVGVFSMTSLFNYIADEEIVDVSEITFADIKKYLSLDKREMEYFMFAKASEYVEDVFDKFKKGNGSKSMGMVFVTASGKKTEPVQRIITSWEMMQE